MRMILLATVVLGLTASSVPAAAPAPEWVEFTSATTPPTPFALKQAKARGIELKQEPGRPLRGLLVRPAGEGPFPAVVLLHGCDGIQPFEEQWAEDLVAWGYAALLVDSHGPRGIGDDCASVDPTADNRTFDAFGTLSHLRGLPFIDRTRIGVIGSNTGGRIVIFVMNKRATTLEPALTTSMAFSRSIRPMGRTPAAPLLMLLRAAKDNSAPAKTVLRAVREFPAGPVSTPVEVACGSTATRFDDARFAEPVHLEQAPAAATGARTWARRWLIARPRVRPRPHACERFSKSTSSSGWCQAPLAANRY